jgi:hypothetical protein
MSDRPPTPGSYRALLIGIDDYGSRPLRGCVNDIDQIEAILLERLLVPPERITRLAAPRPEGASSGRLPSALPTLDGIRGCLTHLADTATSEERVFLYYSGHGAQVPTQTADVVVAREALVPVDVDRAGGGWLYDFEINSLLARIADRAADLTLVLDCCYAGSVTRGAEPDISTHVRHYEAAQVEDLPACSSPVLRDPLSVRDATGIATGEVNWVVVAACRANESAREMAVPAATPDHFQGALTHVFVELLRTVEPRRLAELRWADLWPAMLEGVDRLSSRQHPNLIGRRERRVFGGSWAPRDLGYLIRPDGGSRFRIEAGSLIGITPGALVGVYGQEPDIFPPLDSALDLAARRGVLRVVEASRSEAKGEACARFELPANSRGRLLEPGRPDRLLVALEPFDSGLAGEIAPLGVTVLSKGRAAHEAELELRREGADLVLYDEVHDDRRDSDVAPLLRIPQGRADDLERALRHYARYNSVLRLARRCLDLPGALSVTLLDWNSAVRPAPAALADPLLPEVNRTPGGAYTVRESSAFVIRVANRSNLVLHVSVFNCTGSGRVEYLGNETLAPKGPRIFWQGGRVGEAFAPTVATASAMAVDRIVVVATTNATVDLSYLELPRPIADVLTRDVSRDTLRDATSSPVAEQWTALLVPLLISRW